MYYNQVFKFSLTVYLGYYCQPHFEEHNVLFLLASLIDLCVLMTCDLAQILSVARWMSFALLSPQMQLLVVGLF